MKNELNNHLKANSYHLKTNSYCNCYWDKEWHPEENVYMPDFYQCEECKCLEIDYKYFENNPNDDSFGKMHLAVGNTKYFNSNGELINKGVKNG